MIKTAIVLSGGGAKGAYQIGVWKGLRKLHIKYDIVTGTSVGALNGVFLTQKTYYQCLISWLRVNYKRIFKENLNINSLSLIKKIVTEKGLNPVGLNNFFKNIYNERKFYNSHINYGLVTYNLSNLKPIILTKNEISKDKLKEYVLASATCFPVFKAKEIDGEKYIDGGYYDILPINLAISMGATNIIAIDLEAIGIKQKIPTNIEIKYIKPTSEIGSTLDFKQNIIKHAIKIGYQDTLKAYNKLDGNIYTFHKNDLKYIEDKEIIDYLGETFNLKKDKIYSLKSFNHKILKEFNKLKPTSFNIKELTNILDDKYIIKFFYDNDIVIELFKNQYLSAKYIKSITKKSL